MCRRVCRGLCSILSSSAILVLDIVDVAVGAAPSFSRRFSGHSYVTAFPATIALPSYGACLVILSAISLFGVGFRSTLVDFQQRAACRRGAGCPVLHYGIHRRPHHSVGPGLRGKARPRDSYGLGDSSSPWPRCATQSAGPRTARSGARDAFDALRARRRAEEQAAPSQLSERLLERRADRAAMRAELTAKYFSEESPKPGAAEVVVPPEKRARGGPPPNCRASFCGPRTTRRLGASTTTGKTGFAI